MSYLLARMLMVIWVLVGVCGGAWASTPASSAKPLLLGDGNTSFILGDNLETWLDIGGKADVAKAASAPEMFETSAASRRHVLTSHDALWIKLHLMQTTGNQSAWTLNIPLPFLDSVTLYQRVNNGTWTIQTAGDTTAPNARSNSGLYPDFELHLQNGEPQDVYLQIRNFKPASIPIRLAETPVRNSQRQLEAICLGLMLGGLLCLALQSLARYQEHGNKIDVLAALYAGLTAIALAQVNGVMGTLVWAGWPQWNNYANSVLPIFAMSCTLYFVRSLYKISTHYSRYEAFMERTVLLSVAVLSTYVFFDRTLADWMNGIVLVFSSLVGLAAVLLSWRGGSPIGRTLTIAYIPQFMGLMYASTEALGLVPTAWEMRYLTSISVAISVPALIYALRRVTHARKEVEERANQLPTQDALTGLLTPQAFDLQLQDAYKRALENREPVALVVVNIINLRHIRESLGDAAAEQCLLRAVIKLHRVLRDADPAGRIGAARFALLMEGASTREDVNERMIKLIASGLIPVQGLESEVTLQFQAACLMLHQNPVEPDKAMEALSDILESMSPRTRRPIRFLDPVPTQAAPLQTVPSPD